MQYLDNVSLVSFPEFALTCAQEKDNVRLADALRTITKHADYFKVCNAICDTLLRNDKLDFFINQFNESYMQKWCKDNTAYVIEHCPTVLNHWAYGFGSRYHDVFFSISACLENQGAGMMLSVLRSTNDQLAATMLLQHLQQAPDNWFDLSPAWIGTADSQLRQEARNLGWHEELLPAMVYRSFWQEHAPHWYPNVQYPYSLMACQTYKEATIWGPDVVSCVQGSNPLDIALAKTILAYCKKESQLTIRRTRAVKAVDPRTQRTLNNIVLAHLDLEALHVLERQLAFGCLPGLEEPVKIPLPEFLF